MTVEVTFNSTPTRSLYVVENVRKTDETDTCFVVTTRSGEILRFPWTSIAWARTDTGVRS